MKHVLLSILFFFCLNFVIHAQIDGDNIFSEDQVINIELEFSQTGFWDSLTTNYATASYMRADLTLSDNTGSYTFNDVGVRLKGNSTYNHPNNKKAFKIDFNEYVSGQNYDGLKKLNFSNGFKDPSFLREKVFFDICRAAGVPAPRANFANVYFNGTLWGFYTVVEQIDDQFLDWRILDDAGNLFKAGDNFGGGPSGGGTPADLVYYGESQISYTERYELKTNETANDWSDLILFTDFINNSSASVFESDLGNHLELEEYLRSAALDNLFCNLDSYTGSARNYYLYHNSITNKWEWIKWDANETFGSYGNGNPSTLAINYRDANRPLLENVFDSPLLYNQYKGEMCYLLDNFFTSDYIDPMIDDLEALIQSSVYADNNKMYTNADFNNNVDNNISSGGGPMGGTIYGLKSFVQARVNYVAGLLDCSVYTGTNKLFNEESVKLYPNPAKHSTSITWDNLDVQSIKLFTTLGATVYEEKTSGKLMSTLDLSGLTSGLYFIVLEGPTSSMSLKLVID